MLTLTGVSGSFSAAEHTKPPLRCRVVSMIEVVVASLQIIRNLTHFFGLSGQEERGEVFPFQPPHTHALRMLSLTFFEFYAENPQQRIPCGIFHFSQIEIIFFMPDNLWLIINLSLVFMYFISVRTYFCIHLSKVKPYKLESIIFSRFYDCMYVGLYCATFFFFLLESRTFSRFYNLVLSNPEIN